MWYYLFLTAMFQEEVEVAAVDDQESGFAEQLRAWRQCLCCRDWRQSFADFWYFHNPLREPPVSWVRYLYGLKEFVNAKLYKPSFPDDVDVWRDTFLVQTGE